MTLDDFPQFERYSSKTAFVEQTSFRTVSTSYRELASGVRESADWLQDNGIVAGDRVILWAENSARWAMLFYACLKLRAVVVPIDAAFSESFVEKIRQKTNAKLIWRDSDVVSSTSNRVIDTAAAPDTSGLLEIIYTSGTTGDPKGVMITHGNLLSNLEPVYNEVQKYRKYTHFFSQFGFVHLIPLSHLFGQVMGLFIPQMLGGKVIFTKPAPSTVVRAIRINRASAAICVPHEIALLRQYITGLFPNRYEQSGGSEGSWILRFLRRWWKYRKIHGEFGWKFWAFISGGASLPAQEEDFWRELGFAVIQGYGLTETAPSVTITHPFKGIKRGSVGKKLPGLEVRIADDGEILVRGPNVSPGYYGDEKATSEIFHEGWLQTGDLGKFDEAGNLTILGRKKDVIVTANGLNVYPQDVEAVLERDPRVREAAVVAKDVRQQPEVHAVLVLQKPEADIPDVVRIANGQLESYQQIQSYSLWPEDQLPRTSTGKLMRSAIARGIPASVMKDRQPADLLDRILAGREGEQRIDEDLALSSLDRVELMMELEQRTGRTIDDASLARARTLSDLAALVHPQQATTPVFRPRPRKWHSRRVTKWLRILSWYVLVFPVMALRLKVRAKGVENLRDLRLPVLFVANHQSILDVPAILKALPVRLRSRLAPAMGTTRTTWENRLAAFFFHTYPLPESGAGLRDAIVFTGELADRGYCPLIFPEGARTPDGRLLPFRPGIGVIAKQTNLPILPILLHGAYEVWPLQARGPKPGTITVTFGPLMDLTRLSPAEIVSELEAWYRGME